MSQEVGQRYKDRKINPELNRKLLELVENFIRDSSEELMRRGYSVSVAGSLKNGAAIYWRDDDWFVKDVDLDLYKNGSDMTFEEAMELRQSEFFFNLVQDFLAKLQAFFSTHQIKNNINEMDFIYNRNRLRPQVFAIGVGSTRL